MLFHLEKLKIKTKILYKRIVADLIQTNSATIDSIFL